MEFHLKNGQVHPSDDKTPRGEELRNSRPEKITRGENQGGDMPTVWTDPEEQTAAVHAPQIRARG